MSTLPEIGQVWRRKSNPKSIAVVLDVSYNRYSQYHDVRVVVDYGDLTKPEKYTWDVDALVDNFDLAG